MPGNCFVNIQVLKVCVNICSRWKRAFERMRANSARTKISGGLPRWCTISITSDGRASRSISARPNNEHAADKEHPAEGAEILRELGYPEEMVRAILSHADYTNVPRTSQLEHTLFACDELAGFLTACSYVRPSKSVLDLEVDSVKRRLKDKAFAKGINREDVRKGAEELGVPLEEHVQFCIAALRENADALGLRGSL